VPFKAVKFAFVVRGGTLRLRQTVIVYSDKEPLLSFRALLRKRRNLYGFTTKQVPEPVLKAILETASHVPSAGFTQDFDFVVVRNNQLKKKLGEAAGEDSYMGIGYAKRNFISKAPVIVVPCASKPRFEAKYGKPAEKNARLPWWLIDAGFASLALILSAFEKGLGASFIGAIDDEKVSKALGLPADHSIVPLALIPVGYKDDTEAEKWRTSNKAAIQSLRMKPSKLVHWDGW